MQPFVARWSDLSSEVLRPIHVLSRHPFLLARFGLVAFPPANLLGRILFRTERTKALFAGLAAHSFLSLDEPLSGAFAVLLDSRYSYRHYRKVNRNGNWLQCWQDGGSQYGDHAV